MASNVFKKADRRFFIAALESSLTHSGLSLYESGLGLDTNDGSNKEDRSRRIVHHIFEVIQESDAAILDMLDHLYVESTSSIHLERDETYQRLQEKVLRPRGVELTDDGFVLDGVSKSFTPVDPPVRPAQPARMSDYGLPGFSSFGSISGFGASDGSHAPQSGLGGFGAHSTTGAASTPAMFSSPGRPAPMTAEKENNLVFVVHGRDRRPVEAIERFLQFAGLKMLSWTEAVNLTGESQPHTFDVVRAGMDAAAAIIVIFSPDDEARLHPSLRGKNEPPEPILGQARQNVILEAGMAFAYARARTIFVQSEPTRPISDIDGFNWVKLDGKWDSRKDLVNRLRNAGAAVKMHDDNLGHRLAGAFMVS